MPRPSGIPRLQELEFLADTMTAAADGQTFDQIRLGLIDSMERRRAREPLTGNHAGVRRRDASHDDFGYLHNASEALAELMRLGFLERQPLPSSRATLEAHRMRTFQPTATGASWAELLAEEKIAEAYDELFRRLWRTHPQFKDLLQLLQKSPFIIPTAQWGEARYADEDAQSIHEKRSAYLRFLTTRCAKAMAAEELGWEGSADEIDTAIRDYVDERIEGALKRGREDPYPRGKDFTTACEEGLVKFAFAQVGVKIDYISLEILRRWWRALGLASFSYHVPSRPALIIWNTADLQEEGQSVTPHRRTGAEYERAVLDLLPDAFASARRHERSDFVSIYTVRAAACYDAGVSDRVFDRALTRALSDEGRAELSYRVHLDPAQYRPVPPTERPFTSGTQHFYSMTLVPAREKSNA